MNIIYNNNIAQIHFVRKKVTSIKLFIRVLLEVGSEE